MECTRDPLVPLMVNVKVPDCMVLLVVTDIVELPDPATELELKLYLAPLGRPVALKATVPLKPFSAAIVAV